MITLCYLCGPHGITGSLQIEEGVRRGNVTVMWCDVIWCKTQVTIVNSEDVDLRQKTNKQTKTKNMDISKSWKRQENELSLGLSPQTQWNSFWISEFQNWNIINVCYFKPLSLWSFIIGAMGKLIHLLWQSLRYHLVFSIEGWKNARRISSWELMLNSF